MLYPLNCVHHCGIPAWLPGVRQLPAEFGQLEGLMIFLRETIFNESPESARCFLFSTLEGTSYVS